MSRGISAVQVRGDLLDSQTSGTIPLYIGGAPYWHVDRTDWSDLAGKPYVIKNMEEARELIGYYQPVSGAWQKEYSLCEAVYQHFNDKTNAVGPIILLLNAADVLVDQTKVQKSVILTNFVGKVDVNGLAVLNTVGITGKIRGVDFNVSYDEYGQSLVITDLKKELGQTVQISYDVIQVSSLGSLTMDQSTFTQIDYLEQTVGVIPSLIAAPGWEDITISESSKSVAERLIEISDGQINNHWYTQCYLQLDSESMTDAITDKSEKGYTSPKCKPFWPYVRKGGLVFHSCISFIIAKMLVDINNKMIPFESGSNEIINIDGLCDKTGRIIYQKESESNELNAVGITTCNFVSGQWRTWGCCMGNYVESDKENILPEYLSDVAVQMRDYVCNDFQSYNVDYIDKPIPLKKAKEIIDDYQVELNYLVNIGALLFGTIGFTAADNKSSNLADGNFVFNIRETNTPTGKSITAKVKYATDGLTAYNSLEGDE